MSLTVPVWRHVSPGWKVECRRWQPRSDGLKTTVDDLRIVVAGIDAQLPYLATKADLAEKPSKTYMWGILAVPLTAYACGLAGLAILQ